MMNPTENCPCCSGEIYAACCGPYIDQKLLAPTPEKLMRSRYTAIVLSDQSYLKKTMRGKALKGFSDKPSAVIWIGLEIIKAYEKQKKGYVEFIATYYYQNQKQQQHELSKFEYIQGAWYYVDGVFK